MNSISSRQLDIDLLSDRNGYRFKHEGQHHVLPSMDRVHAFFQKQPFDTVKLSHEGKKSYVHFSLDEVEVFDSKKALRKILSQEGGGTWVEEKNGKKRFFVDDSGWFNTSYKQVSKKEFLQRVDSPSTLQKVLGIGLGVLALLPGALEIKERLPFGASEAGMGLLALQRKSPLLGLVGYSLIPSSVDAQAMGTEFQVNNYTTSIQNFPVIAPLNDGGFVVAWQSEGQDGDSRGIFAQRYNSNGSLFGSEFQVNNFTTSNQQVPAIAPLNDGGFVVTCGSDGQDGDLLGVFAQRYGASGATVGSEFQVNNFTTSDQQVPAIAPLNDGGFVVAWYSNDQDGDSWGIFAQRYDTSGALFGSEFQVNNYTINLQIFSEIAPLNDGGFVVAWQSEHQDGNKGGIFAQRYDISGALVGSEFQVNNYTMSWQRYPTMAPLNDGGFVVAWYSNGQDGDSWGIFAQRYDTSGALFGSEFQVNNYMTSDQLLAAIAPLNDGGFVIVWQSLGQDGDGSGIFGRRYDASGAFFGSEFQINNYTTSDQQRPGIASLNDGGFVVVWQSLGQDGDGYGIFGQRYDRDSNPIPLTYVPSMSSATTNFTSSSTTVNDVLSSSPSGFGTPPLIDVVYGDSYPITQNGQTIGTFTISGGTGLYSGSNPNTLNIEIDPDIVLQDGDTVTLFSVPEGEEPQWEGVTFLNSDGCFNAEGELVQNEENNGSDYQVIFSYEGESCSIYGDASKLGAIPVLTSGGLI